MTPTNEPVEEWARRLAARLTSFGQEVKTDGWEDWARANAEGEVLTRGLVEQMLEGDEGGIGAVVRELRDMPSELSHLAAWLRSLQNDWYRVFHQGWLWWTLNRNLPPPATTDCGVAVPDLHQAVGNGTETACPDFHQSSQGSENQRGQKMPENRSPASPDGAETPLKAST
jgi:hypothetical protein